MVQHTILSLLDESPKHGVSVEKIVEKISHNPSKVFNINRRGFIKEGYFADIVLIDPNIPTLVTKKSLLYKCCLLYTSPSPRDVEESRMPSSA